EFEEGAIAGVGGLNFDAFAGAAQHLARQPSPPACEVATVSRHLQPPGNARTFLEDLLQERLDPGEVANVSGCFPTDVLGGSRTRALFDLLARSAVLAQGGVDHGPSPALQVRKEGGRGRSRLGPGWFRSGPGRQPAPGGFLRFPAFTLGSYNGDLIVDLLPPGRRPVPRPCSREEPQHRVVLAPFLEISQLSVDVHEFLFHTLLERVPQTLRLYLSLTTCGRPLPRRLCLLKATKRLLQIRGMAPRVVSGVVECLLGRRPGVDRIRCRRFGRRCRFASPKRPDEEGENRK